LKRVIISTGTNYGLTYCTNANVLLIAALVFGVWIKLQKSTISFFMSARLYARNKSAPTVRFSVTFDTETHIKIRRENRSLLTIGQK